MTSRSIGESGALARAARWLGVSLFLAYAALTRGHFAGTDEIVLFDTTESLWRGHGLAVARTVPPLANTFPGPDGRVYGVYNPAQSLAALPLYGLGRAAEVLLAGRPGWLSVLAGPRIGHGAHRWGGSAPIFFVNLFNAAVAAAAGVLFFAFSLRLGVPVRWALAATLLLAFTSHLAPFATGFLQHPSEALLLLASFYFLERDATRPRGRDRLWAGVAAALLVSVRLPAAIALPGLGLSLLLAALGRERARGGRGWPGTAGSIARQALPFAVPVLAALAVQAAVNAAKFGAPGLLGGYGEARFDTPVAHGLFGLLLSPGASFFLYTPLLVLLPWTWPRFRQAHRELSAGIALVALSYLLVHAKLGLWHGLWSAAGPRYLVALVPLLLLPLGGFLADARGRARAAALALGLLGLWVQAAQVACNFGFVYLREGWPASRPPYSFLFLPDEAVLLALSRGLLAGDDRVDLWLVQVGRAHGLRVLSALLVAFAGLLALALARLRASLRHAGAEPASAAADAVLGPRGATVALALLTLAAASALGREADARGNEASREPIALPAAASTEELLRLGLRELHDRRDGERAAVYFAAVLEREPEHFAATFLLGRALAAAGRGDEALPLLRSALARAEAHHDEAMAALVRKAMEDIDP